MFNAEMVNAVSDKLKCADSRGFLRISGRFLLFENPR